ncbi:uncharacterized protein LOC124447453 isoform X3 [Xenia sp. Carnegie-2017]|uniref:uncharacterized protein LOC124447453 isoform X3 n=1 Tax=Xenia sp. Carnegie-2017 TaxID=2897299 RepID=UPI001F037F12|nr:uncharacterized protein LOC124447453 isoform X3 [Xenia sp. Carnegie-2017]
MVNNTSPCNFTKFQVPIVTASYNFAIAAAVIDGFLILFGIVVNLPLVFIIAKNYRMLQTMDLFVFNLCVADLVSSVFYQPLIIMRLLARSEQSSHMTYALRMTTCSCLLIDCAAIFLITFDKYLGILYPLHYSRWFNKKKVAVFVILCWIFAVTFGLTFAIFDKQVRRVSGYMNACLIITMFVTTTSIQLWSYLIVKRLQKEINIGQIDAALVVSTNVNDTNRHSTDPKMNRLASSKLEHLDKEQSHSGLKIITNDENILKSCFMSEKSSGVVGSKSCDEKTFLNAEFKKSVVFCCVGNTQVEAQSKSVVNELENESCSHSCDSEIVSCTAIIGNDKTPARRGVNFREKKNPKSFDKKMKDLVVHKQDEQMKTVKKNSFRLFPRFKKMIAADCVPNVNSSPTTANQGKVFSMKVSDQRKVGRKSDKMSELFNWFEKCFCLHAGCLEVVHTPLFSKRLSTAIG